MARPIRSRRRWIPFAVVTILFLGLAAGALYVYRISEKRTDPYGKAVSLLRQDDEAGAEALLQDILEADPTDVRARNVVFQIQMRGERLDDAEATARYWLDVPETEALGLRALSQVAFQRMDFVEAMRLARLVADRDPVFSQRMLMQAHDALGTPANRERSARAAETLAALTTSPDTRAAALLYAAETLRDLERALPEGPRRDSLADRRELARKGAREGLLDSERWQTSFREAQAMLAQIDLLGDDQSRHREAVEELEAFLEANPEAHAARASLFHHLVARGQIDEAYGHLRELRRGPTHGTLRALEALARAGERTVALEALAEAENVPGPIRDRLRAGLLLAGDDNERELGLQAYEKLAREHPDEWPLVQEAYVRILQAGDPERALQLLEQIETEEPRAQLAILVERTVAAVRAGDAEAGAELLAQVAERAEGRQHLDIYHRLRQIEPDGERVALEFLDRALHAHPEKRHELRLLRAAISSARTGADGEGETWIQRAREDLTALAEDPETPVAALVNAIPLALAVDAPRLTGRLLGGALVREVGGGEAVELYLRALATAGEEIRPHLAAGLRQAADEPETAEGRWLDALAEALENDAPDALRRPRAAWSPSGKDVPQPAEALLQLGLAAGGEDWAEAEAYARGLLEAWPELAGGKERLGAVLLAREELEEILSLHEGEDLSLTQRGQRIEALRRLGRQEDALAEARTLLSETDGSERALMALGELLQEVDPDAAIATIATLAGRPRVDLLRGKLLEGKGDEDAAAQIYVDILRLSGWRNLLAWRRLARIRAAQDRDWEFVSRVSSTIDAPPQGLTPDAVVQLVLLRAQARERTEEYGRALEDYQRVLSVLPNDLIALNNAAWVLGMRVPRSPADEKKNLEQALDLANQAVDIASTVPPVFHTRAKILEALGRSPEALEDLDRAIELMKTTLESKGDGRLKEKEEQDLRGRMNRYLLDKGALLETVGREDEARAIYEQMSTEDALTPEGRRAAEALSRMGE